MKLRRERKTFEEKCQRKKDKRNEKKASQKLKELDTNKNLDPSLTNK